jgi:hypothetical protein
LLFRYMPEVPGQGEREQRIQLNALDMGLAEIKRVSENPVAKVPRVHQAHLQKLGEILLGDLPNGITDLDLGSGISVSRRPEQKDNRQTWSLQQVDQHAANLARSLGREYRPKFAPSPGR